MLKGRTVYTKIILMRLKIPNIYTQFKKVMSINELMNNNNTEHLGRYIFIK